MLKSTLTGSQFIQLEAEFVIVHETLLKLHSVTTVLQYILSIHFLSIMYLFVRLFASLFYDSCATCKRFVLLSLLIFVEMFPFSIQC